MTKLISILIVACATSISFADAGQPSGRDIIQGAMDNWRGLSSYSEMTMTIHRPTWSRSMSMRAWTLGEKQSLVRVTQPKKDAGNATLVDDDNMWSFSPKINRVIKIPSSMMNQSWMGSDFSNKDISRSTEILDDYTHTLDSTELKDGHRIYTVTSIPHDDAPVVWGKQILKIRDDYVMLEEQYWDQDGELVKVMEVQEIAEMGGRMIGKTLRMYEVENPEEWTEVTNHQVEFDIQLPDTLFTLSNLRNPRQ